MPVGQQATLYLTLLGFGPTGSSARITNVQLLGPDGNTAPVANADSYSTSPGQTLKVGTAAGVLANDTDAEDDPLTAQIASQPAGGTVTLKADGSFTYTPKAGFSGVDTFTYQASDGQVLSEPATVSIFISNEVAVDDSASTRSDTPVTINVLANDHDSNGTFDPSTVAIATAPASGSAVVNANGTITYTPGTTLGNNTFTYTVKDNLGAVSNPATVTVFVNAPPVAANDSALTRSDKPVTINVLGNDSDVDGSLDASRVAIVSAPSNGTAVVNPNGTITYTPGTTLGNNTFTYTVKDNLGTVSNTATVTVFVNALPWPSTTRPRPSRTRR